MELNIKTHRIRKNTWAVGSLGSLCSQEAVRGVLLPIETTELTIDRSDATSTSKSLQVYGFIHVYSCYK